MSSTRSTLRDFIIGLTAIVGFLGVGVLLILFGELRLGDRDRYSIFLQLNDVSGISDASEVTLNGVRVGYLEELRTADDPRTGVVVELAIDNGVQIPRDVDVLLERGLVGEATLSLQARPLEPGQADPGVIAPDETLVTRSTNLLEEIGNQVTAALDERLSGLNDAIDSFAGLADSLNQIADEALEMVEPRTPDQINAGAAPNLPSTLARLDSALVSAQTWMDDEELRTDFRSAASRAVNLLDDLEVVVEEWTTAAQTLAESSEQVGAEATSALAEFSQMTRTLTVVLDDARAITGAINEGKGTAGMLVHNPDLYRSLNDAAIRLEQALVEAQLLIEKYRKEGVPIQF